eukprot:5579362-Pleurochrysis_carterae.AAC.1
MKWVVSSVARSALEESTNSHTARRECGSIPAVGSSSSTNLGSPRRARMSESLRRCPPERVSALVLSFSDMPSCCSQPSTCARMRARASL